MYWKENSKKDLEFATDKSRKKQIHNQKTKIIINSKENKLCKKEIISRCMAQLEIVFT